MGFLYDCIQQLSILLALFLCIWAECIKRLTGSNGKSDFIAAGRLRRIDGFCSFEGFIYFNRHSNTDGKKWKKDKSFAAALPGQTRFSVVPNGYNDDEVRFLTPHLKLYFLYLALFCPERIFQTSDISGMCSKCLERRKVDHWRRESKES